jgi:hypothetical protein
MTTRRPSDPTVTSSDAGPPVGVAVPEGGGVVSGRLVVEGAGAIVCRGSKVLAAGGGATRCEVGVRTAVVTGSGTVVVGRRAVVTGSPSVVVGRMAVVAGSGLVGSGAMATAGAATVAVDGDPGRVATGDGDAGGFDVVSSVSPSRVTR